MGPLKKSSGNTDVDDLLVADLKNDSVKMFIAGDKTKLAQDIQQN